MAVSARQTKVGINIATAGSWSTGVASATAVGAGDGHYVLDDLGAQLSMNYSYDESAGQSFIGSVQAATVNMISGAIPMYLHYHDAFMNVLWGLMFGTGGTSPTQVGTTTAYTNTFQPATSHSAYCTIVRDKSQYISEVPGAMLTGFTLTFGQNGRAEIRWNYVGDREVSGSTVNTATQINALTFPTQGLRAFFDDAVFRLNAQAGAALGASDKHYITGLTVTYAQPYQSGEYVSGATSIIQPVDNGHPVCTIDLTFARFDSTSDDYFAAHRDVTEYKADLTLTGPTLATGNYKLLFEWPRVVVESYAAPVPGAAGQVQPTMRLRALSTTTAPTGMTGITVPVRLTTTGVSTTNPFA